MYPDLRRFVDALESAGELVRIKERTSPVLAITGHADRASKSPAPNLPSASAVRNDPAFAHLGGPALLFENVEGSDFPLLINAYGSYRRMEMALGCPEGFDSIAALIGELVKPQPPRSLAEAVAKARLFAPLLKIPPKRRRGTGPCQEVVRTGDEVDLTRLPMLRCWPLDGDYASLGYPAGINDGVPGLGHPAIDAAAWDARYRGRYITLAGIHTIHADDRHERRPTSHNIGMYRVQLFGKNRLSMHWHMHHDGAAHWRSWKKLGEPMPVAVVLGGEAVLPYAATAPLPPGISELLMAGFLNKGGIEMVRAKTVPLWVPANAEIVIEGFVRTDAGYPGWEPRGGSALRADFSDSDAQGVSSNAQGMSARRADPSGAEPAGAEPAGAEPSGAGPLGPGAVFEGPFGDHTGFYSLPDRYPVLEVSAVTHRKNAIYPTTVVGLPPQEDYFLGKATERLFLPLLKVLIPDIVDYDLPMFGAFHNCAFIKIRKHYPLHARRVMHAIWGAGQMAWTKAIFVVDDSVDVHDTRAVLRACADFCLPSRDIETVNGALDILDHAAPRLAAGVKMGFDCTPKIPGEEVGGVPVHKAGRAAERGAGEGRARWITRAGGIDGVAGVAMPTAAPGWGFVAVDRGWNEPERAGLGRRVAQALAAFGGPARGDSALRAAASASIQGMSARRAVPPRPEPAGAEPAGPEPAGAEPAGAEPFRGNVAGEGPAYVVVVGRDVDLDHPVDPLFHWLANADPGRDAVRGEGVIVFDATPKTPEDSGPAGPVRAWPPVLRL